MGVAGLRSSISLSLIFHLLFILALFFYASHESTRALPKAPLWITVDTPTTADTLKKKLDENRNQRIVQTRKTEKSDQAAPNAFLGAQNQVVERQMVSKNHTTTLGEGKAEKREKEMQPSISKVANEKKKSESAQPTTLGQLGIPIIPRKTQNELSPEQQLARDRARAFNGEGIAQDYVQGMKEGETTALNTREYVFYGYFQRIRERLDRAWNSSLRDNLYKLYRRGRHLASDMDHTTKVMVTLNSGGEITRVQILEESGTRDLDDAAVKAFNQAGPFPNPPKGIIDQAGQISIRWDFVIRT